MKEGILHKSDHGPGLLGLLDGAKTKGIETDAGIMWRKDFLRRIGYKI
jgi:adenosine/AMP kinase